MIAADDVQTSDERTDVTRQELISLELDLEEQAVFYAVDSDVEDAAVVCQPGQMFEVCVTREISENVIAAIKRQWESSGWTVGALEIRDPLTKMPLRDLPGPPEQEVFRLVFARPHRDQHQRVVGAKTTEALMERQQAIEFTVPDEVTIERIVSGKVRTSTPLLIRMPTRGRPKQALEVLAKYRSMAMSNVAIEVIIDVDDPDCNTTQFLQALNDLDCYVTVGKHKNKIEACNAGRIDDWGVLMLASDDMVPVVTGYDQKILAAMEKHFPLLDGAVNFHDGYNRDHVQSGEPITNTLPVMGRWLYEDFGGVVYHQGYRSIYCDTDATFLFNKMNRMVFVDEMIVEHRHFANEKARFDALYQHNSRHDNHDKALFEERRVRGFDAPSLLLSILICSVPKRRRQLEKLVDYLRWQMRQVGGHFVEICVDLEEGITVGAKRQRLLERACGKYITFIDDDDWVHEAYVKRVLNACMEGKDCCSLMGIITENGENPQKFDHSIKNSGWFTREDGSYARTPNHLSCVRRDLALQVGFPSRNVGEDHAYSRVLSALLKSEADTGPEPLYFYWSRPTQSVQNTGLNV